MRARPPRTQTLAPVSGARISKTEGWACLSGSMKGSGATVVVIPHSLSVYPQLRNGSVADCTPQRRVCALRKKGTRHMRRNPGDRDGKSTTSTLQKANCSIPVFLALFDPVKACVHSMWRMCASVLVCECVCVCQRERGWEFNAWGWEGGPVQEQNNLSPPHW